MHRTLDFKNILPSKRNEVEVFHACALAQRPHVWRSHSPVRASGRRRAGRGDMDAGAMAAARRWNDALKHKQEEAGVADGGVGARRGGA